MVRELHSERIIITDATELPNLTEKHEARLGSIRLGSMSME
jgi:hypothetical protein